jgi:hypothetical protein
LIIKKVDIGVFGIFGIFRMRKSGKYFREELVGSGVTSPTWDIYKLYLRDFFGGFRGFRAIFCMSPLCFVHYILQEDLSGAG